MTRSIHIRRSRLSGHAGAALHSWWLDWPHILLHVLHVLHVLLSILLHCPEYTYGGVFGSSAGLSLNINPGNVLCGAITTSSNGSQFFYSYNLSVNSWHHYGITWDGSNAAAYLDGGLFWTGAATGALATGAPGLRIGDGGRTTGNTTGLLGYVDDFRVYGRVLSAQDMAGLWNKSAPQGTTAYTALDLTGSARLTGSLSLCQPPGKVNPEAAIRIQAARASTSPAGTAYSGLVLGATDAGAAAGTSLKGAIWYQEGSTGFGRGSLLLCQNSNADSTNAGPGNAAVTVTNAGFLGINNSNPISRLHITGTGSTDAQVRVDVPAGNQCGFAATVGTSNWSILAKSPPNPLSFEYNGTPAVVLSPGGNMALAGSLTVAGATSTSSVYASPTPLNGFMLPNGLGSNGLYSGYNYNGMLLCMGTNFAGPTSNYRGAELRVWATNDSIGQGNHALELYTRNPTSNTGVNVMSVDYAGNMAVSASLTCTNVVQTRPLYYGYSNVTSSLSNASWDIYMVGGYGAPNTVLILGANTAWGVPYNGLYQVACTFPPGTVIQNLLSSGDANGSFNMSVTKNGGGVGNGYGYNFSQQNNSNQLTSPASATAIVSLTPSDTLGATFSANGGFMAVRWATGYAAGAVRATMLPQFSVLQLQQTS
jgi:hypothetical protein